MRTGVRDDAAPSAPGSLDDDAGRDRQVFYAVAACFLLSGFAALLYQTAWLRQFSVVFGTSELAVATVLAAYMAGLAAGAAVAGRFMDRVSRPVLVYGLLEAGIAGTALLVPYFLETASLLYGAVLGGQVEPPGSGGLGQPIFYLGATFVILALPTGFMGATLPLLTRHAIQRDAQVGPRVAALYAINTAGAVLGTLVAAFVLLPRFGLRATVISGAAVNLLVFLVAALLARRLPVMTGPAAGREQAIRDESQSFFAACVRPIFAGRARPGTGSISRLRGEGNWVLPLMLVSGAVSFTYEVLWTRLLSHVLGGTIYAFATMLATFLAGIALGGALAGKPSGRVERSKAGFVVAQASVAVLSAAIYLWLTGLTPGQAGLAENAVLSAAVMLPATVFIGATFPLAVRILTPGPEQAGHSTARVYAWNTAGAISGSVIAGFLVIPWLGFAGTVHAAIAINFLLAVSALLLLTAARLRLVALAATAVASALLVYRPAEPMALIDTSIVDSDRGGKTLYYSVGRSATVFLKERDGNFYLRTNGLPEALIEPRGAPPMRHDQKWLTALPVAARPDAKSVLIVGFGGGVAIEGVPPGIEDIDVIELEPDVIAANREVATRRRYDPLGDERVNIVLNDARNAMALTSKQYDIVVSQPSHPWTAGASHLYTREFVQLGRKRLAEGGVFVQWINSSFVDENLLRSLAATLLAEFDNVRLYQPSVTVLLFLASNGPLDIERQVADTGRPLTDAPMHYARLGINAVEDLVVALTADEEGVRRLASGAPVSTDDDNRMAVYSRPGGDGLGPEELARLFARTDPLLDRTSWLYSQPGVDLNLPYIGFRLMTSGMEGRAVALAEAVPDEATQFLIRGLGLRHRGRLDEATRAFRLALERDPENRQAAYALVHRFLPDLARGDATELLVSLAGDFAGAPAAIVQGWKYGMQRDWVGLSRFDAALGDALPTDLWYVEAVKLQADWRTKTDAGNRTRELNLEARDMIDRALMISRTTDLLVLRAATALRLDDPSSFVETAWYVKEHLKSQLDRSEAGDLSLGLRERRTLRVRAEGFVEQLGSDFVAPVGDRAAQVRRQFEELLARP